MNCVFLVVLYPACPITWSGRVDSASAAEVPRPLVPFYKERVLATEIAFFKF